MIQYDQWHGKYKDGWKGHITSSSFSHPAKFSKGLIFHIIQHVIDEGWVIPGKSTCVDPFAGIGGGALPCALQGIQWVGCELESRFVTLANGGECGGDSAKHEACSDTGEHGPHHLLGNLELWQRKYGVLPQWKQPILLQGDSRELGKIIEAHADLLVSSSPYTNQHLSGDKAQIQSLLTAMFRDGRGGDSGILAHSIGQGMGTSPGQLGNLPPGSLDAALAPSADLSVTSPPDADGCTHTGGADPQPQHVRGGPLRYVQYGAELVAASPPHGPEALGHHRGAEADAKEWRTKSIHGTTYSASPQNLGNMPAGDVAAVVQGDLCAASPPFNDILPSHDTPAKMQALKDAVHRDGKGHGGKVGASMGQEYGSTNGQLGNTQGTTFWSAARTIIEQTFQILKPGAHAVWVTKMYIRDGKLVDFPGDWERLCRACGFETVHIHLAMLVERRVETHLFEGEHTYEQWTESFFRRLSRKKTGVGIEFETVICQVKPLTTAPMPPDEAWEQLPLVEVADCSVSSAPFHDSLAHNIHTINFDSITGNMHRKPGHLSPAEVQQSYGTSPAQLGALRVGSVDAAIISPPYNLPMSQDHNGSKGGSRGTTPSETGAFVKYGSTPGQLEGMAPGSVDLVLTSPAYGNSLNNEKNGIDWTRADGGTRDRTREANYRSHNGSGITAQHYGTTTGQLGSMPAGETP